MKHRSMIDIFTFSNALTLFARVPLVAVSKDGIGTTT